MLHVKSEDLRLYDLTASENNPKLMEDETLTLKELDFDQPPGKEGFKLLIESELGEPAEKGLGGDSVQTVMACWLFLRAPRAYRRGHATSIVTAQSAKF